MFRYSTALGRQLLTYVLAFSFVVTLVSLFYILFSDYQRNVRQYSANIIQIENSYQKSLSYSLWNFDSNQVEAQLHGILNFPGVVYTYIENKDEVVYSAGNVYSHVDERREFRLTYKGPNETHDLGVLHISLDYSQLHQELAQQTVNILTSQFVKTFAISIFLLFIVNQLITSRLASLADWARNFSLENLKGPQLKRHKNDEIGAVSQAIHQMLGRLKLDMEEQKKAHQQLENTRNKLSVAVDNAGIGFCTYNAENDTLESNSHFAVHLATTETELEGLRHPINELLSRIQGSDAVQQREKINQLLIGRLSRMHDLISIEDFQDEQRFLEITLQISRYRDTRPAEILICSVDRTQEQMAMQHSRELTVSLENKVTARTEDLYNEQLRSRSTIRKLEQEVELLQTHYTENAQQEINHLLYKQLKQAEALVDNQQRDQLNAFMEYLIISECKAEESIDLPHIIREQIKKSGVSNVTLNLPFSLIIEEDPEVFRFLTEQVIVREQKQNNPLETEIRLKLNGDKIQIQTDIQTSFRENDGGTAENDIFRLCEHLIKTRFQGTIERTQSADHICIRLELAIRNH